MPQGRMTFAGPQNSTTIVRSLKDGSQQGMVITVDTVSSRYLKVEVHLKLLISQSKFSGPRKFTLRHY